MNEKNKNFEIITYKVKPNKPKTRILKIEDDMVHIDLAAPPVDNKANDELIDFISKEKKIKKQNIEIISGAQSKVKRVKILK